MARWECKSCSVLIDNGEFTHPENQLKEWTINATACPICESKEGYTNPDYGKSALILPPEAA